MNGRPHLPADFSTCAAPPSAVLRSVPASVNVAHVVAWLTQHILQTVCQSMTALMLDVVSDAEFIEKCLNPQLERMKASGLFDFGRAQRHEARVAAGGVTRVRQQRATCRLVTYLGRSVDAAATERLLTTPLTAAELAAASAKPLDWFEIDNSAGGCIVFSRVPFARSSITDAEIERELARAVAEKRFADVIHRAAQRSRQLFFSHPAEVIEFDRGTLTALLMNSYLTARSLGIRAPHALDYAFNAASLVRGRMTRYEEAIMSHTAEEQVILMYIDYDLLTFYASVLHHNRTVHSVAFTHSVIERRLATQELDTCEAVFLDEFAVAVAAGDGATEWDHDDVANLDDLDDEGDAVDEELRTQRRKQKLAERDNKKRTQQASSSTTTTGGPSKPFDNSDVESVLSIRRSINSQISASGPALSTASGMIARQRLPNGEFSFGRTPFRVLDAADYEFADRLRSQRYVNVRVVSPVEAHMQGVHERLVRKAPLRFERRYAATFATALRLFDTYYGYSGDVWNVRDYFHLYQLVEIEMCARNWSDAYRGSCDAEAFALSAPTDAAIVELIGANAARKAAAREEIALATLNVDTLRCLVRTVIATIVRRPAARLADGTPLDTRNQLQVNVDGVFSPDFELASVLDNFQTQTSRTMRQRRANAAFINAEVSNLEEMRAYIDEHGLYGARERMAKLDAAAPHDRVTAHVIRMVTDAHAEWKGGGSATTGIVTPLAILSTLRAYGARDGDDVFLVWTPAVVPPLRGYIYVAMRERIWRRLVDVVIPRAVVEQRALGHECKHFPLMAPLLARALDAHDPMTVGDALAAVQTLLCRAPARLPYQWTGTNDSLALGPARHTVSLLHKIANAVVGAHRRGAASTNDARALVGAEMLHTLEKQTKGDSEHGSLFAALQVALSGENVFLYMDVKQVQRFVEEGPAMSDDELEMPEFRADMAKLRALLRQQLSATRNAWSSADIADAAQTERSECRCGALPEKCTRLSRALAYRRMAATPGRLDRGDVTIECCLCEHVRTGDGRWRNPVTGRRKNVYGKNEVGQRVHLAQLDDDGQPVEHKPTAREQRTATRFANEPVTSAGVRRMKVLPSMCEDCQERVVCASSAAAAHGQFVPIYDPVKSTHVASSEVRASALRPDRIIELLAAPQRLHFLYGLRVGTRPNFICKTILPRGDLVSRKTVKRATTTIYRHDVMNVVAETCTRANVRRASTATQALSDAIEAADRAGGNNLLGLLMLIEMLPMVNQRAVCGSWPRHDELADRLARGRALSVLDDRQLAALSVDGAAFDGNGVCLPGAQASRSLTRLFFSFPLCESAILESVSIWQSTVLRGAGTATVTRSLSEVTRRAERLLYAGRTPRPASTLPPAMMEMLLTNWYNGTEQRFESDDIDPNLPLEDDEDAEAFEDVGSVGGARK